MLLTWSTLLICCRSCLHWKWGVLGLLELTFLGIQLLVNGISDWSLTLVKWFIWNFKIDARASLIFCRTTYLPALMFARQQGLYVTLHCGEVINLFFVPFILVFLWQFFLSDSVFRYQIQRRYTICLTFSHRGLGMLVSSRKNIGESWSRLTFRSDRYFSYINVNATKMVVCHDLRDLRYIFSFNFCCCQI